MNKKDGDFPAFPCREKVITGYTADVPVSWNSKGTVDGRPIYEEIQHDGMALRDYFAAKAMNGFVSNFGVDFTFGENVKNEIKNLSKLSYCISDAMLNEREK